MWWIDDIAKARKDLDGSMDILRIICLTFGDQSAAAFLQLCLRTIVAPHCRTRLGRVLLESHHYVDDGLKAHHDKAELYEAMEDVVNTLQMFGFEVKHICNEHLSWHNAMNELNPDGSTTDGPFDTD